MRFLIAGLYVRGPDRHAVFISYTPVGPWPSSRHKSLKNLSLRWYRILFVLGSLHRLPALQNPQRT